MLTASEKAVAKQLGIDPIAPCLDEYAMDLFKLAASYREALEWYANPANWESTINGVDIPVELDQGKTARKALGK